MESEESPQIVVARGVDRPQRLDSFGRQMAEKIDAAEFLVTISGNHAVEHKRGAAVLFLEVDPADSIIVECMNRIKQAWEDECEKPVERRAMHVSRHELGHVAAGFWLFYWLSPTLKTMITLAREGDAQGLRDGVQDFIDSKFARESGPTLAVEAV